MSFFLDPFEKFSEIETAIRQEKQTSAEDTKTVASSAGIATSSTPALLNGPSSDPVVNTDFRRVSPKSIYDLTKVDEDSNRGKVTHAYTRSATVQPAVTKSKSIDQFLEILQSM